MIESVQPTPATTDTDCHSPSGASIAVRPNVLACPTCQGRMKLLGLVKDEGSIVRTLAATGEATEVPCRSPGRGPPYWKSRVLRLKVLGEEDEGGGRGGGPDEVA